MRVIVILTLAIAVLAAAVAAGPLMSSVEEPPYKVETSDGAIELRHYPEMMVATTDVAGNRRAAIQTGFRALANYIFGGNERATKIEMTAPVLQTPRGVGKEPLQQDDWSVRFIMPRSLTRHDLPAPNNQGVTLEELPAATYVVIRFSGFTPGSKLRAKTNELQAFMARKGLAAKGEPIFAFYNPPWTLPFLRRNEVMIGVR